MIQLIKRIGKKLIWYLHKDILDTLKSISDNQTLIETKLNNKIDNLVQYQQTQVEGKLNETKLMLGQVLNERNKKNENQILKDIKKSEYKIFSQWGDDGIIQFLVNYLDIENKIFIEFGVENYKEANTRFLLMNNNWKGIIFDGNKEYINQIKNERLYWEYDLTAQAYFVTKENINMILKKFKLPKDIGLLHIDIDGNDYFIWKEITDLNPVIVIMEYNSVFGNSNPWTIPYKKDFFRTKAHFSNLYFGSSILSLCDLAQEKGYIFVGCNSAGNNAYFVRKDKIKNLKKQDVKNGYVYSVFRESRDEKGDLTYISGQKRLETIKGMEIYNTRTNKIEKIVIR